MADGQTPGMKALAEARRLLGLDDVREARRLIDAALRLEPDSYPVLLEAATAYAEMDKLESAESLLAAAIALFPDRAPAYRVRGLALLAAGRAAKARADLERARALDPKDPEVASALVRASVARPVLVAGALPVARVLLPLGDARAFPFPVPFSRAVKLEGDLSPVWCSELHRAADGPLLRSRALALDGDLEAAERALDGVESAPLDTRLDTRRCLLAFAAGRDAVAEVFVGRQLEWEGARACALAAAMRGRPSGDASHAGRATSGLAWLVSGCFGEARRDLSYATVGSAAAETQVQLGAAALGCGDRPLAQDAFAKAAELRPSRSPDKRWRALVPAAARLGLALLAGDPPGVKAAGRDLRRAGDDASAQAAAEYASALERRQG